MLNSRRIWTLLRKIENRKVKKLSMIGKEILETEIEKIQISSSNDDFL